MGNLADNFIPKVGTVSDQRAITKALKNLEGAVVPVVFGQCKVQGKQLWLGNINLCTKAARVAKFKAYGNDSDQAYSASIWEAIGMGDLEFVSVQVNDKFLQEETDYDLQDFNDGSPYFETFPPTPPTLNSPVKFIFGIDKEHWVSAPSYTCYTSDLIDIKTELTPQGILAIAADGSIFVAIHKTNSAAIAASKICFSYNGVTWVEAQVLQADNYGIAYGNGKWVIVGAVSDNDNYGLIFTSTDPTATDGWVKSIQAGMLSLPALKHVAFLNEQFIAVGNDGCIVTSPDGVVWTKIPNITWSLLNGITYGEGLYVAVGGWFADVTKHSAILTSTDGVTWTLLEDTTASILKAITYNSDGSFFSAVSDSGEYLKSVDGAIWTTGVINAGVVFSSIAYGDGTLVAVGDLGKIYTSTNGTSWTLVVSSDLPASIFILTAFYNNFMELSWVSKLRGIAYAFFPWKSTIAEDKSVLCSTAGVSPKIDYVVYHLMVEYYTLFPNALMREPSYTIESPPNTFVTYNGKILGNHPVAAIYEILINTQWGLGIPAASIDYTSFRYAHDSFTQERSYGLNTVFDSLMSAREALDKIKDHSDVFVYEDGGKIYAKLLYDENAGVVLALTDDDVLDLTIQRQTWKEVDNVFEGEYTEPALNYETKTIIIKNEAAIINGGYERKKKIDLTSYISATMASSRLNEIMQRESFPKIAISVVIGRFGYALRPGDLVSIVNTEYSLSGIFRVSEVQHGGIDDMSIQLTLTQAFEELWDKNYNTVLAASGGIPRRTA